MLPAPARIAAPPRPKSRASWNPAVPPPPVAGAAVGNGLADLLGVADDDAEWLGVSEGDADRLGVSDELPEELALALALVLGEVAPVVPLGLVLGVADPVSAGKNGVGVAEGEDVVQAETDSEASMVKVAQLTAVSLALSPVLMMIVRTFMGPPHASGRWRTRFPVLLPEEKSRADPVAARAGRRQVPGSADGHKGKAHGRKIHAMASSSSEY